MSARLRILLVSIIYLMVWTESEVSFAMSVLPKIAPAPKDNPITDAKISLGQKLFFDPRLSKDGSVSCNSCHNVMAGGEDNRPNSVGISGQKGGRSSPTVWNAGFLSVQFWDGRAASLEDQAKGPLTNPIEMGMPNHDLVVSRVSSMPTYVRDFEAAFGKGPITIDHVAKAIATYERTLTTPNSPFDKYLAGNKKAMSAAQLRGFKLVQEVGCTSCHSGAVFAGPALPVGTGFYQKFPVNAGSEYDEKYKLTADLGRFDSTKVETDRHMWRVPTWRNIALTAPYFHNGSVPTLEEAIRVMAKTQLAKNLPDTDVKDIASFMEALTGDFPKQSMPRLPATEGRSLAE